MKDGISTWLATITGLSGPTQWKIFVTLLIVCTFWLIRFLILKLVFKNVTGAAKRYKWQRSTRYITSLLVILVIVRIWFTGFGDFVTYLGLLSAGLAIALQDLLKNIAGWFFIIWRRPFTLSDRIQIGDHAGDVVDIRLFQFTILEIGNWVKADQSTGRIIHIPNGRVFVDALANFNKGFGYIWSEIPILVTFESDWKKAKDILNKIVVAEAPQISSSAAQKIKKVSRMYMIFYNKLSPIVYSSIEDSGVLLTIRYLTEHQKRRFNDEKITEAILDEFHKYSDIDFAYPTQRFYDNLAEGRKKSSNDIT